jgi:hypothetical protein
MKQAKLINESGQRRSIEKAPSVRLRNPMGAARLAGKKAVGKKPAPGQPKPARSLRKQTAGKSGSDKLVCRYCGSDDLAPSFIKRRDRRCSRCFSKRYGSAARARKTKVKK